MSHGHSDQTRYEINARIDDVLRYALAIGGVLLLLLPAARGFSQTLGWLPLWLLAMPAVALWALRGFPLPRRAGTSGTMAPMRRRRPAPQARRRAHSPARRVLPRAA